ncbi:amidohydrolase family protein [Pseudoalteromonas rubra]|uniref:amidohydrolase family protein n=1 Tax=Pseudoalteromonas rubra TaxID=43658 RepID=UPI000F78F1B2|nr:amidohydrolase family protein [Pseudoalteromonas rubra]
MQKVIDCDRHVIEPVEIWKEYISKEVYEKTPIWLKPASAEIDLKDESGKQIPIPPSYMVGEEPVFSNWGKNLQIASALINSESINERLSATNPIDHLEELNRTGVDKAIIYPTFAGLIVNHSKVDALTSLEFAKGYNRWIEDYCNYAKDRFIPAYLISRHDPSSLVEQVEDAVRKGWSALALRPEPILGIPLGDDRYEQFWQACAHHELAVTFHGGTHLQGETVGMDRFKNRFSLHACSHPMEAQMAFVSLLESGVFERNPKLKIAFLEAGCSWVPHWLWRLDNICHNEFPSITNTNIRMRPSEYFIRHCWVGVEIGEPISETVNAIGHEKLIFGSDYPHPDHLHFDLAQMANEMPSLSNDQISDILQSNPRPLFNL